MCYLHHQHHHLYYRGGGRGRGGGNIEIPDGLAGVSVVVWVHPWVVVSVVSKAEQWGSQLAGSLVAVKINTRQGIRFLQLLVFMYSW